MRELKLRAGGPFRKSAKISGDVMGNFHPHGDQAIYDALVRLAQDFNLRYPLVDGQGNFGNIDGDNAAAARYTEARLTSAAEALMNGLDEDAVDFRPNYDGTLTEPVVMPASLPKPARQRRERNSSRNGDRNPPAQCRRALRRLLASRQTSRRKRREFGEARSGTGFSHRRRHRGAPGTDLRGLPDRTRNDTASGEMVG